MQLKKTKNSESLEKLTFVNYFSLRGVE